MIWIKNIIKNLLTVLSLGSRQSQGVLSYLISCFRMVRVIGGCLSQRFSKNSLIEPKCQICVYTSWNCGTVLVIGLVFTALIGWMA